jgi:hypothetical protein
MLQSGRAIEFFRVWAFLETVALSFTISGIFFDLPVFVAAAGGMFFCITVIGIWMKVVRPLVVLATATALAVAAIFVGEPWYYGSVGGTALLVLANMPQNVMLLCSRSKTITRQLTRMQKSDSDQV